MNKILIVEASESDRRDNGAAKEEVAKLPPGAVINSQTRWAKGCRGDEIRPWHSARVNQLAEDWGIRIPRSRHNTHSKGIILQTHIK